MNVCAALAALAAIDVEVADPAAALAGFAPLAHRLQSVCERDGVTWVDDSISTTPESTVAALASFPGRAVVLIAGGQDRGQDHGALARALAASGGRVIGVPTTGARLVAEARAAGLAAADALEARDLLEAVELARGLAHEGDVVLLSPAAPSYDHYRDFEERGELFAELAAAPPRSLIRSAAKRDEVRTPRFPGLRR
jgi:UDP-N-acetylmuramoylalanine--D-glutamate ligase